MKKLTTLFAVLLFMTISANVMAQNTATVAEATASARIITKITLENSIPLNFGTIAQTVEGGTVTLSPLSDEATYSNIKSKINSSTETRASFDVTGEAGALFSIILPSSDVTLTRASGTETMTVGDFTTEASLTENTLTSGESSFHVGATLNVIANQVPGNYSGSYAVTVNYN